MKKIIVILICFVPYLLCSQNSEDKELKKIKATATVRYEDKKFSPQDIENLLILKVKDSIYRAAQIKENVQSWVISSTSENRFVSNSSVFKDFKIIEALGLVNLENIKFSPQIPEFGKTCKIECVATVKLLAPSFITIKISDLKETYYNGDDISFSFTLNEEAYVRVIALDADNLKANGTRLQPSPQYVKVENSNTEKEIKNDFLFEAGKIYKFPFETNFRVRLDDEKDEEWIYFAFIAVKKQKPILIEKPNYEDFFSWYLNNFSPQDRSSLEIIPVKVIRKK